MSNLLFFNPWNDIALASDSIHFTPPPAAQSIADSGSTLPYWYGNEDDYVMVDETVKDFYETISKNTIFQDHGMERRLMNVFHGVGQKR